MFKILFIVLIIALVLMPNKHASRSFSWLFLFATLLLLGLRHMYCYQDTYGYVQHYNMISNVSFKDLPQYFERDVIFWYFSKLINVISGGNYSVWFSIISFIYIYSIYFLLKKESYLPAVSILVLIVIGLLYFPFTGMRQTISLAVISISMYFLLNNENKKAALMVVLASLFHATALIFIIAIPLCHLKINKTTIIAYLIAGLIIFSLGNHFSSIINSITSTDRFAHYADSENTLSFTGFFIKLFLLLVSYYFLGQKRFEKKYSILINLAIIGLIAQSLSAHLAEMFRISMYFSLSYILLFANAISEYKIRTRMNVVPIAVLTLLVVYIYLSNNSIINKDYYFFFDSYAVMIKN